MWIIIKRITVEMRNSLFKSPYWWGVSENIPSEIEATNYFSSCSRNCIYHYLDITVHKYHNKLYENITLIGHNETDSPDIRQIVESLWLDR